MRILWLWCPMLRQLGLVFEESWVHVWWVLVHWNVAHFIHVCICADLWRGMAAAMPEERAFDVARCG